MTMWVIYEKKKILAEGGFEPQISGRECKMLPLSYGELLHISIKKSLEINTPLIQFQPFLAMFRHFPPFFTYIPSKYTFPSTFFHKINFPRGSEVCFQNGFGACNFENPGPIFKIFVTNSNILCHVPTLVVNLFEHQPNLQKKFPFRQNLGFAQKSFVNSHFFL